MHNSRWSHSIWYTHDTVSFDYTTVGHVTADVMADGSRRAGGSAFYSALQASRLGRRALILTRGVPSEIEQLLEPHRGELELKILTARATTTLQTLGAGASRAQRMIAWAGPIAETLAIDTAILHLAPVARETPKRWRGRAEFVGLTAQGLVRSWAGDGARVHAAPLEPAMLPERCDAIVISETERSSCSSLLAGARDRGAGTTAGGPLIAVTAQAAPTTIRLPDGQIIKIQVPAIERVRDDIGAGDVFSAAFFVALGEGRGPHDAAAFANAAAALRIAGAGAAAIGDRAAIESRLAAVV
jgi:sugar/nucleoside kinase (ribokinase family)